MTINEYINFVKAGKSGDYTTNTALIALCEEIGEVCGVIKKTSLYPDMDFRDKFKMTIREKLIDELGDVLWQYVNLLDELNIDINEIINHNYKKLIVRYDKSMFRSDGGNR